MKVFQRETHVRTVGGLAVRDITDEVTEVVHESGVQDGIACVYSPHTTCCVRVNEFERGFLEDFAELLRRLCPTTPTTRTTTGIGAPRTSAPRTWTTATATRTAWRCCSAGPASRCRCETASSSSGTGSACCSSSSTESATAAGSSRSSVTENRYKISPHYLAVFGQG